MFGVSKNKGSRWTLFWLEFQVLLRYNFNELVIKRPLYASFFYIIFTLSGLLVGFTNFRQATSQPKAFQRVLQSNRSLSIIYSLAMYAKIMRSDRRVASKCRTGLYDGVALTYPALLVPAKYVILFGTLHAIPFLLYSAIVYPVAGLAPTFFDRGLLFIVILWMQDLACMSIGFFLSCTLENYLVSY